MSHLEVVNFKKSRIQTQKIKVRVVVLHFIASGSQEVLTGPHNTNLTPCYPAFHCGISADCFTVRARPVRHSSNNGPQGWYGTRLTRRLNFR